MNEILTQNFFALLRSGAFATDETIEPMSAWKWKRLFQFSVMHGLSAWMYEGVQRCSSQFFLQLPDGLEDEWKETLNMKYEYKQMPLTNKLLRRALDHLIDEDTNESSQEPSPTLTFFLILVDISKHILNIGIPLAFIVEAGLFLRNKGDKVDYVKLEEWISRLKIGGMAQLTADILVNLLGFTVDEIPFWNEKKRKDFSLIDKEMFALRPSEMNNWYFQQGKDIFVHTSNSQAMLWHVRRSAKYFRYYPAETFTNFFTSFAHSLSHIEE